MQVFNASLFLETTISPPAAARTPDHPPAGQVDSHVAARDPIPAAPAVAAPAGAELDLDLDSDDFTAELARLARQEAEERTTGVSPQQRLAGRIMPARKPEPEPASPAEDTRLITAFDDLPIEPAAGAAISADAHEPLPDNGSEPVMAAEPDFEREPAGPGLAAMDDDHPQTDDTSAGPDDSPRLDADPFNLVADRTEPGLTDELAALDDEPLHLHWQPARRKAGTGRWWTLLSALALCGLLVQYLYYNFEQLARQDNTRPWLESLCGLLPCQLPGKSDVSQIKSTNLIVRQHPGFQDALIVDAILYNRAPFSQPFPLLELNFLDDNETPVASRAFHPREYLAGELAGRLDMPSQTPIHIALEVLTPDARATRYGIRFLAH